MIVQSDFLTHWKLKALATRIGMEAAVTSLLALWAHCEKRRAWEFELTPLMLAGICDYKGMAPELFDLMLQLRLIEATDKGWFQVHEWGKVNAALVCKWAGHKGKGWCWHPRGFVCKVSNDKSVKDTNDQSIDQSIDASNDRTIGLDRIGEDRIGEERRSEAAGAARPPASPDSEPESAAQKKEGGRGAPANVEEALAYAASYSKGNGEMLVIDDAWVRDWHDERESVGWMKVSGGVQVPITDWRADLLRWCRRDARLPRSTVTAKKEEGGAGAATIPPPPDEHERALAALYGDDWEARGIHWYSLPHGDRVKIRKWCEDFKA